MDATSFVVSFSGLVSVFEASCKAWRTIRAASGFGADVADAIRKLEMEFFRFYTWWDVLRGLNMAKTMSPQGHQIAAVPKRTAMAGLLSDQMQSPILNAAESILAILVLVEHLLSEQGVLAVLKSDAGAISSAGGSAPANITTEDGEHRKKRLTQDLISKVSWWKRVKYDATPWRQSNKHILSEHLANMNYWNNSLYGILPSGLRDSVLRQGISAYLLVDSEELESLAKLQVGVVSRQAQFNHVFMRLASLSFTDNEVQSRLLSNGVLRFPAMLGNEQFSFVQYQTSAGGAPETALVEWYSLPDDNSSQTEIRKLVRERLAKMSLLLDRENRPETLQALDCLGCTESPPGQKPYRFGLISRLPPHVQAAVKESRSGTITLHEMLGRKQVPGSPDRAPLPTLAQRFQLAASLAETLYTLILADWHHKLFSSLHVLFIPVTKTDDLATATTSVTEPTTNVSTISSPFICGFSIARPSAPEEISISGPAPAFDIYLHSDLRTSQARNRPRYTMRYEVYSFGLLLAEIGFWQPLHRLAKGNSSTTSRQAAPSPPEQFHKAVVEKCRQDLACWMGDEYAAVTLRCLEVGPESPLSTEKMAFYWSVIWQLEKCAERMKAFTEGPS